MKNILFVGELPPKTIHGVSNSSAMNIKILSQCFNLFPIEEYIPLSNHNQFTLSKIKQIYYIVRQIRKKVRQTSFDFFYANMAISYLGMLKNILYLMAFKQKSKGKAIFHIHRGDFESFYNHSIISKLLINFFVKRADKLIFLSETLVPKHLEGNTKVCCLANTIIPEREYLIRENNKNNLLYLSNYIAEKGIIDLLNVFKTIEDNNLTLNCYGSFTDKKLEKQIRTYQSNSVRINSALIEEKFNTIHNADALVLPSYNEGQPLIILEAMMCGTIVIASDVGDIRNMLGDDYPFLFQAKDLEGLKKTIYLYLKTDKETLTNLSEHLQKRYFKFYSNKIHKERILKIFDYES